MNLGAIFGASYSPEPFCEEVHTNARLRAEWESVLRQEHVDRKLLEFLVLRGVNDDQRGRVWKKCAEIAMSDLVEYDVSLGEQVTDLAKEQVMRDVHRTFSGTIGGRVEQDQLDSLRRILEVYSVLDPDVGYTQGINFILSMPILYMNEEDSFVTFYAVMSSTDIYMRDVYTHQFPGFRSLVRVFTRLLERRYPWACEKIADGEYIDIEAQCSHAFMSITMSLTINVELKRVMFDRLLVCGKRAIVSLHLAAVRIFTRELQAAEKMDAQILFAQAYKDPIFQDYDRVIEAWNLEWVSESEYVEVLDATTPCVE